MINIKKSEFKATINGYPVNSEQIYSYINHIDTLFKTYLNYDYNKEFITDLTKYFTFIYEENKNDLLNKNTNQLYETLENIYWMLNDKRKNYNTNILEIIDLFPRDLWYKSDIDFLQKAKDGCYTKNTFDDEIISKFECTVNGVIINDEEIYKYIILIDKKLEKNNIKYKKEFITDLIYTLNYKENNYKDIDAYYYAENLLKNIKKLKKNEQINKASVYEDSCMYYENMICNFNEKLKNFKYDVNYFSYAEVDKFEGLINTHKTNNALAYEITIGIIERLDKNNVKYNQIFPENIIKFLEDKSTNECLYFKINVNDIDCDSTIVEKINNLISNQ